MKKLIILGVAGFLAGACNTGDEPVSTTTTVNSGIRVGQFCPDDQASREELTGDVRVRCEYDQTTQRHRWVVFTPTSTVPVTSTSTTTTMLTLGEVPSRTG